MQWGGLRGVIEDLCSLHPFFGFYQIWNFRCYEIKLKAENLDEKSNSCDCVSYIIAVVYMQILNFFKSYFAITSFIDRDKKHILFLFIFFLLIFIKSDFLSQSTFFKNIFRLLVQSSTLLRFQNHVKGY